MDNGGLLHNLDLDSGEEETLQEMELYVDDVFGTNASGHFVRLGLELLKEGQNIRGSVTAILHEKYGAPEGWGFTAGQLDGASTRQKTSPFGKPEDQVNSTSLIENKMNIECEWKL